MSWKYIFFDLDGTITDSSEGILNCIEYSLVSMGHVVPVREELFKFIGPPLINGFLEITGLSYEEAVEATAIYREKYSVTGLFENIPYNGIEDMLKKLKENGELIYANYVETVLNTSYRVNGKCPYNIICEWNNPLDNNKYIFKSKNIWINPENIIEEKNIKQFPVYIDNNKKKYTIDIESLTKNIVDLR